MVCHIFPRLNFEKQQLGAGGGPPRSLARTLRWRLLWGFGDWEALEGLNFALSELIPQIWPMRSGNTSTGGGTPGRVRFDTRFNNIDWWSSRKNRNHTTRIVLRLLYLHVGNSRPFGSLSLRATGSRRNLFHSVSLQGPAPTSKKQVVITTTRTGLGEKIDNSAEFQSCSNIFEGKRVQLGDHKVFHSSFLLHSL